MAISFPLTSLFTEHTIKTLQFKLMSRQEFSRTQGGRLIAKDFSRAIWMADYVSVALNYDDAIDLEALLHALDGSVNRFLGKDTRRAMPRAYPTGNFNDTGQIASINANRKALTLSGLDANFAINRGDRFHFTYSDNGETIYSLHEASEAVTANGVGVTAEFEVRPHLPDQAAITNPVVFKDASCLMVIERGSVEYSEGSSTIGTVSFKAAQVL